ncbi:MAG: PAS domain S-box protein [Magnetococcus sp. DMHC-6]
MSFFRFGVTYRLFSSWVVMTVLTFIASGIGIYSFHVFQEGLHQISLKDIEKIAAAYELGRQSEAIVAATPALANAETDAMRKTEIFRLNDQLVWMKTLTQRLDSFGIDQKDILSIQDFIKDLDENIQSIDSLMEKRISTREALKQKVENFMALRNSLYELTLPPPFKSEESPEQESLESTPTLVPLNDTLDKLFQLFLSVYSATEFHLVQELNLQASSLSQEWQQSIKNQPDNERKEALQVSMNTLRELISGTDNLFQLRSTEIRLERQLTAQMSRSQFFANRFASSVEKMMNQIHAEIDSYNLELNRFAASQSRFLILLAIVCALTAFWIILYVIRRVIRPLNALQAAMVAHAQGEDTPIPELEKDEIGAMGRSLAFFVATISEREKAIRLSEQRLLLAMEISGAGVYEHAIPMSKGYYFSQRWAQILGYEVEDIPALITLEPWLTQHILPEDQPQFFKAYQAMMSGAARDCHIEIRMKRKSGEIIFIQWLARAIDQTPSGEEGRVIGLILDISQRKQQENELILGQFSLEQTHEAVFWIADTGRFFFVNQAACRLLGYSKEALIGKSVTDLGPGFPRKVWPSQWDELQRKGNLSFETVARCSDGSVFPIEVTASFQKYNHQPYVLAFLRDISERKRHEAMREAKLEAEAANQAKSAFLTTMSHEIRSPINAIMGMGEMLSEANLPFEYKQHLDVLIKNQEILFALLSNLLDLSELESGQLKIERSLFHLDTLMKRVIDTFQPLIHAERVTITYHEEPALLLHRWGDPVRLRQILTNLISNAIHLFPNGTLAIQIQQERHQMDGVRFSIVASGREIPLSLLNTLFEANSQSQATSGPSLGGATLRLSICKHLVEQMGGKIWAESRGKVGGGFHFFLNLEPCEEEINPLEPIVQETVIEQPKKNVLRILVAEDAPDNAMVMSSFLSKTGYQLEIVQNGALAVEAFQKGSFDLILMDIRMPVLDGLAATAQIRQLEKEKNLSPIPIIALTAHTFKADRDRCLQAGCTLHLSKPIRKKRLLETIDQVLSGQPILDIVDG